MRHTKNSYGNCVYSLFWLCLRMRVVSILCFSSRSRVWPYHFVCVAPTGRCFHFYHVRPHRENPWAPWWFEGRHEVFRSKREAEAWIGLSRRRLVREVRPAWVVIPCAVVWLLTMVPYIVCFGLYVPACDLLWAVRGRMRRNGRSNAVRAGAYR